MTYYQLSDYEADKASDVLCPTGLRLFLYIRSRCPFDDSKPSFSVNDLAARFKVVRDTILRLLREMKAAGLLPVVLHTRILNVGARVKRLVKRTVKLADQPPQERSPRSPDEIENDRGDRSSNSKPSHSKASGFTNNRSLKPLKEHGESTPINEGGIGQLLAAIEAIGARANQTIQREVYRLNREFGFAAAARRVELAIGAVQEQVRKGSVRNIGGLMKRALERQFTPNDDGYKGRSSAPPAAPPAAPPPSVNPPDANIECSALPPTPPAAPPRLSSRAKTKFQQWVDLHLLEGNRAMVLERLAAAISQGYEQDVSELLMMRRDWKIRLKDFKLIDLIETKQR